MESTKEAALRCADCGAVVPIPLTREEGSAIGQIRAFLEGHDGCRHSPQIVIRIPHQRDVVRAVR